MDWSHPIAQGLQFAFAPGMGTIDLVTGVGATRVGTTSVTGNRFGVAGTTIASPQSGWRFQIPDAPFLGPISLLWVGRVTTIGGYNSLMSKCVSSGVTQDPFDWYTETTTGRITLYRGNTTSGYFQYASGLAANTDSVVLITSGATNSAPNLWINGAYITAPAQQGAATGNATGGEKPIGVGLRDDTLASAVNVALAAAWSRQVSGAEAQALYADPFCFLRY